MNLEPIDTSTTAGKARVMQLAAEGRKVLVRKHGAGVWGQSSDPWWDWRLSEYAVVAESVGPEEVACVIHGDGSASMFESREEAERWGRQHDIPVITYVRADLAGRDE